jgi:hypothetical protein
LKQHLQLNKKQSIWLSATQPIRVFLGGRGSGKSFVIGISIILKLLEMPRCKGALVSTNFNQLKTKSFASIKQAWEKLGFVKDVHYVVGRPPRKATRMKIPIAFQTEEYARQIPNFINWDTEYLVEWERPIAEPESYKNVVTFFWGSCVEMISMHNRDSVRGGSYDFFEIDEAALLQKADYTEGLLPARRGNRDIYTSPYHQQISFYTSIPWKPSGYFILDFEEKAKLNPKQYFFLEANAYDNIEIIGEAAIELMREEMDHLEFMIEVMNQRIVKSKNPFYGKFDADRHTYKPQYEYKDIDGNTRAIEKQYDNTKKIEGSFDFGGHINSCTIWQQQGNTERCLKEFYKKGGNTLRDLINAICKHYESNGRRHMDVWGEPRGWNQEPGSPTMYDMLTAHFAENRWTVDIKTPKNYKTDAHKHRQELVNNIFEGRKDLPNVLINEIECKHTIIVLQTTESMNGRKDKRKEKDPNFMQENAPHLGDTVDYYLCFKYFLKAKKKKKSRGDSRIQQA